MGVQAAKAGTGVQAALVVKAGTGAQVALVVALAGLDNYQHRCSA